MSERVALRTLVVLAMNVGIAAPLPAQAQPASEIEIACDAGDSLQSALSTVTSAGRIIIRSGTCTGNFTISRDVRIQGSGYDLVTLKAADPSSPVITVPRGVTATISGLSITGGRVGILSTGRLALSFTTIAENAAGGLEIRDNGILEGDKLRVTRNKGPGIILVNADATLRGSVIARNVTDGDGGGGMLLVGARVQLIGTQIEENEAVRDGGGLLLTQKSEAVLDRVRLFRNAARTGHGGAMAVRGSTADVTGSSVFENIADSGNGGGIAVLSGGEARLTNTTIASNVASFQFPSRPGGWGGGLFVDKASKALVVHATIVLNSARFAAGIASNSTVTVLASLLSGNLGASQGGECGGTGRLESKGWNLLMDPGDCRFMAKPGDLIGASPRLGPPGLYGGAWTTVPLRDGSPAIDRIPQQACAGSLDQRLKPRPANGGCDVGAFERQAEDAMP
jgi:hypothetical protein